MSAFLNAKPTTLNDKRIDELILQVQAQNNILQSELEHSNSRFHNFQELLKGANDEFQRRNLISDEQENKISQLESRLKEKDSIIASH